MTLEITTGDTGNVDEEEIEVDGTGSVTAGDDAPVETPEVDAVERPEWLDEKFKTPADLQKAYKELEAKIGKPKEPEAKPGDLKIVKPADAIKDAAAAQKMLEGKKLDFTKYQDEYNTKGEVGAESLAELAKAGIAPDVVASFIEGQKARQSIFADDVTKSVGGMEKFNEIREWAGKNLDPAELTDFNDLLQTGKANLVKTVLKGFEARYKAEVGVSPKVRIGGGSPASGAKPFESMDDMANAMSDPRYRSSEEYRAKVLERIKASD